MSENENFTISFKKQDFWKYSTFVLAALLVVGAIVVFFGEDANPTPTGNVVNTGNNNPSGQQERVEIDADDDAVLGDPDAPVTIIEFSDFQCPFCRKFWADAYPQIKEEYIDTGKVKFVYRDFPLTSIHPMAEASAMAAECVQEAGGDEAYYEYQDKMYGEQMILDGGAVRSTVSYTNDDLKKWAKDIGYDIDDCLDDQKFKSEVQKDLQDGSAAGVRGTPAFFINGQLLSGAQPFSAFKQVIDAELAK